MKRRDRQRWKEKEKEKRDRERQRERKRERQMKKKKRKKERRRWWKDEKREEEEEGKRKKKKKRERRQRQEGRSSDQPRRNDDHHHHLSNYSLVRKEGTIGGKRGKRGQVQQWHGRAGLGCFGPSCFRHETDCGRVGLQGLWLVHLQSLVQEHAAAKRISTSHWLAVGWGHVAEHMYMYVYLLEIHYKYKILQVFCVSMG